APASDAKPAKRKRKFPYRKVPDLEADIATTEQKIADLESSLQTPEVYRDAARVRETMAELEKAKDALALLYQHWEEAVELNGEPTARWAMSPDPVPNAPNTANQSPATDEAVVETDGNVPALQREIEQLRAQLTEATAEAERYRRAAYALLKERVPYTPPSENELR